MQGSFIFVIPSLTCFISRHNLIEKKNVIKSKKTRYLPFPFSDFLGKQSPMFLQKKKREIKKRANTSLKCSFIPANKHPNSDYRNCRNKKKKKKYKQKRSYFSPYGYCVLLLCSYKAFSKIGCNYGLPWCYSLEMYD